MSQKPDQEKTEQATPKRRRDARKKGQVAVSREISSVLVLIGSLLIFFFGGSWMVQNLTAFMGGVFQNLDTIPLENIDTATFFFKETFKSIFIFVLPVMLAVLIFGILSNIAQVGLMLSGEPLMPKFSKLNPISGLKKLVALKAWVEMVKSLLKILIVGGISYLLIKSEMENIFLLFDMSVGDIMSFIGKVSLKILFYTCLTLISLAALDYVFQRWQHEKELKMTKQEVKEETKQTEGDPHVKARIRSIQMEMSRRRMMEAVPEATVVVTNPTRLAVALKFDAEKMAAPKVVAKGAGHVAKRIREIARENDVPLVEHKPLAQTLYKAVEIGSYIPANLYRAVAEILAYVYRLQGRRS